jgi:import inner membrane translocase subunit TIM22
MAADGADPNARLGVRAEDVGASAPPNLFLFPRTFLDRHLLFDKTGVRPFLPAYPPQVLQWVQPNPITESCAGKFLLSAVVGASPRSFSLSRCVPSTTGPTLTTRPLTAPSGYGMGNLFGLVLGSYEGITPPVPIPGQRELPKVPWRESMSASWRVTAGKCRYWGNNFLVISGTPATRRLDRDGG